MTNCNSGNIYVSGAETKTAIQASNNRSRYYAELAKQYKDEAKEFRDDAQYYALQNADVTKAYVDEIDVTLRNLIATKQNSGNYALSSEIPTKLSELTNDTLFVNSTELGNAISAQAALTTTEIGNSISGKLNKDCDNLSSTGKSKVVSLAHELDWANAVTVSTTNSSSNQTYTAASDGLFFASALSQGSSASRGVYCYLYPKDSNDTLQYGDSGGFVGTASQLLSRNSWVLLKGEKIEYLIYASGAGTLDTRAVFIPFKES